MKADAVRILITGAAGQVGTALARELAGLGQLVLATRNDFDLFDVQGIQPRLSSIQPDVIVNAAAYTAVDRAESESALAFAINAAAVEAMGRWAASAGTPLIHFSTDYVFDGRATEPYRETDPVNPLSVYGESKAKGERLLLESGAPCLIVRTAWVYSDTGQNFLKTMVRLADQREELTVVADQTGTPTSARQIAAFVRTLLQPGAAGLAPLFQRSAHVVHFTAEGYTTWHGFAAAILAELRRQGREPIAREVRPISTSDYPTPARRPGFSRLSLERLHHVFQYAPGDWKQEADAVVKSLLSRS